MPKTSAQKSRKLQQLASPYATINRNLQAARDHASTRRTQKSPTAAQRYEELAQQAKTLNVIFHQRTFSGSQRQVSSHPHHQKFMHIQTLGRIVYDSYGLQPSPDTVDKPWQLINKKRAEKLCKLAVDCMEERLNEDGWRDRVEHTLFERFTIEVAW